MRRRVPGNFVRRWSRYQAAQQRLRASVRWFRDLSVWQFLRDHQKLATVIGLLSLIVSIVALANQMGLWVNGSSPPEVVAGPPGSESTTWPATVINTWSDELQKDVGTYSFQNPDVVTPHVRSYFEHTLVQLKCGVPEGRVRQSTVGRKTYESRQWYLTSQSDWLPAVFLKLARSDPPRKCRPEERPGVPTSLPS
jgi:hypothetical protein